MTNLHYYSLRLHAEPAKVVIRPFHIAPETRNPALLKRPRRIVTAVLQMSEAECEEQLALVNADFASRHWQTKLVYLHRYEQVIHGLGIDPQISEARRELIGAYFCHEYSYAAAAVMNPSVVPHVDQSGLRPGDQRFILSLRTVGEGHISTISFREGILSADGELTLWPQPGVSIAAETEEESPPEGVVVCRRSPNATISSTVIFPFTQAQRNGLEDLRMLRFDQGGGRFIYLGAYTAYSGSGIASELLSTEDFNSFTLAPMSGSAARNKGMAIFPRRINGAYALIGRQDGESMYYLESDDLLHWEGGSMLMQPELPWELLQMGNCGAPIELDEGWLLLTHGVGAMRKYSIGAVLLDRDDPRKVLGRLEKPLLSPSHENREGYVPNVVYTCGGMRHGDHVFLPYGVADSAVAFAMVEIRSLVSEMRPL